MTCADRLRGGRRVIVLATVLLAGCAAPGPRVHVRVRNDGPLPWQSMWLGAGGPNGHLHGFGVVAVGGMTPYRPLPAVLAEYRKSDVLVRVGQRYGNVVRPEAYGFPATLPPGHYTFAYRIDHDTLVMDIRRDR